MVLDELGLDKLLKIAQKEGADAFADKVTKSLGLSLWLILSADSLIELATSLQTKFAMDFAVDPRVETKIGEKTLHKCINPWVSECAGKGTLAWKKEFNPTKIFKELHDHQVDTLEKKGVIYASVLNKGLIRVWFRVYEEYVRQMEQAVIDGSKKAPEHRCFEIVNGLKSFCVRKENGNAVQL